MSADETATETSAVPCSACRGTGRVISRLGGTAHEVPCPWCDGTGRRLPGHDAQRRQPPDAEGNGNGAGGGAQPAA